MIAMYADSTRIIYRIERMRNWKGRKFCYVRYMRGIVISDPAMFYCPWIPKLNKEDNTRLGVNDVLLDRNT